MDFMMGPQGLALPFLSLCLRRLCRRRGRESLLLLHRQGACCQPFCKLFASFSSFASWIRGAEVSWEDFSGQLTSKEFEFLGAFNSNDFVDDVKHLRDYLVEKYENLEAITTGACNRCRLD